MAEQAGMVLEGDAEAEQITAGAAREYVRRRMEEMIAESRRRRDADPMLFGRYAAILLRTLSAEETDEHVERAKAA